MVESQRAIEPPLWHIICADYFDTNKFLDQEINNTLPIVSCVESLFVLNTGNNPTAFGTDRLPMNPIDYNPRWNLIDLTKYRAHDWHAKGYPSSSPYGVLYTSISCPFNCKFCFSKKFYPVGYSERPLQDIRADLIHFGENGVKHIKIIDEIFVLFPQRVINICKMIIDLKYDFNIWCYARIDTVSKETLHWMKKAGINWVGYGIESGNESIRKSIQKGKFSNHDVRNVVKMTKEEGIKIAGNFIFGFEDDTMETMQDTLDFADELDCEYNNLYCLVDKNVNQLSKDFLPRATKTLTPQEVLNFRDEAYVFMTGEEKLERG